MGVAVDPVCDMDVDEGAPAAVSVYGGTTYYFCAAGCKEAFDLEPERYLAQAAAQSDSAPAPSEAPAAGPHGAVAALIVRRRSITRFTDVPIPREVIEHMLDAAVWAPNHHLTEPWEFVVLDGDAKERFAEIRRAFRATVLQAPDALETGTVFEKALRKVYADTVATPWIIVVTTTAPADPDLREDDYGATMCAIQNMLLVAAERGLGTYLRTGGLIHFEPLRRFLELPETRRVAGIVYVGYPAHVPTRRRTPSAQKTRWLT